MGPFGWLLQWPIRALVLLIVAALPIGIEMANFSGTLGSGRDWAVGNCADCALEVYSWTVLGNHILRRLDLASFFSF